MKESVALLLTDGVHAKIGKMKFLLALNLFALPISVVHAQSIEIVSPKHAYTFSYGDAISHQIERDQFTKEMMARVTFTNYPYAPDREPRRDEMFDFFFPGLHCDVRRNIGALSLSPKKFSCFAFRLSRACAQQLMSASDGRCR